MSWAGVINSHTMAALTVLHHGTDAQRRRFLPRFAAGEARGGLALTEPHAGSDVQAIRTSARREGDHYVVNGSKMFITNGREGNTFTLLAVTDPRAQPRHRGMSCFVVEKGHPGFRVGKSLAKLGYKGVDTVELLFEDVVVPAENLVGGVEGRGFAHVMSGLETGRINIAARCVGVAQAAYEAALEHARGRGEAPPALADLATGVEAARLITYWAAGMKDRRERCDLEAGMAKLFASEMAHTVAVGALRVHGEAGTLARLEVERHYRDTPLMIIGEGTNEIQRLLIARQLVERHGERLDALTSREGEPDERREIVLAVRQFVEKSLVPEVADHDAAGRYPEAIVRELAALGVLGAPVDPALGGLVLDNARPALVLDGAADAVLAVAATAAAAVGVGLAQAAFEAALRYAQQRTTFGKPLCQHQAVQLKLADMATGITATRLLTYRAARYERPNVAAAAMARLHAAAVALQATLESMRIHGGYGYVREFPVERYYRDAARLPFVPLDDEALRRDVATALAGAV